MARQAHGPAAARRLCRSGAERLPRQGARLALLALALLAPAVRPPAFGAADAGSRADRPARGTGRGQAKSRTGAAAAPPAGGRAGGRRAAVDVRTLAVGQKHRGTVRAIVEYGAWVDIGCPREGLLHTDRIAESMRGKLAKGQEIDVWVKKVQPDGKFGLSMMPFKQLAVGQKHRGVITTIMDHGAYVDIGHHRDGLLHVSRISEDHVENVRDVLAKGQAVDVWVSKVESNGAFGLSMLETLGRIGHNPLAGQDLSPFMGLGPDEWHDGVVLNLAEFGAFVKVTLANGACARGLIKLNEIVGDPNTKPQAKLRTGDNIRVRVLSVKWASCQLDLSMLDADRAPSSFAAFEGAEGQWLEGTVGQLALPPTRGAFVNVTAPDGASSAIGFLHISEISPRGIRDVADELAVGDAVRARVQWVDVRRGRLYLSLLEDDDARPPRSPL